MFLLFLTPVHNPICSSVGNAVETLKEDSVKPHDKQATHRSRLRALRRAMHELALLTAAHVELPRMFPLFFIVPF